MLSFLKQVIAETLRRAVVAPYAARYEEDDIQLGGHTIPAGVGSSLHFLNTETLGYITMSILLLTYHKIIEADLYYNLFNI